ncbi:MULTISPECIES: hypothetical protein [Nocardia]|uniref:hypothetical protein n=1 Tax=Nocardia TaxID=1817 RepID=UPI000D68A27F|nr:MULTISPECIES: hypothetical protein [Nocardia]
MNKTRIEATVNDHVMHVVDGGRIEDEFVEAKAEWPKTDKAGQLGGMANAAHGHPVMWIIGLSENEHRVVPLDETDPADWWQQMQSKFAPGATPDLTVIQVHTDHGKVVCLHFETEQPPYLVKVDNNGWVTAGVPWRSGTRTRTATRSELLSMMERSAYVPGLDLLSADVELTITYTGNFSPPPTSRLSLYGQLFIDSEAGEHIVLPEHRQEITVRTGSGDVYPFRTVAFTPVTKRHEKRAKPENGLVTNRGTADDELMPHGIANRPVGLVVLGPDLIAFESHIQVSWEQATSFGCEWVEVSLKFPIGATERVARISRRLARVPSASDETRTHEWRLAGGDS